MCPKDDRTRADPTGDGNVGMRQTVASPGTADGRVGGNSDLWEAP